MKIKQPNIKNIYPIEDFRVTEPKYLKENNYRNETIFALGNGYLGSRGTFEENYDIDINDGLEGNFINGFYESENISYGEFVYGAPKKSQTMLNITNGKIIKLFLDDEEFSMYTGEVLEYKRFLDFEKGILERNLTWKSPSGKIVKILIKRLISFYEKSILAIEYSVTPINFSGKISFMSALDSEIENHTSFTNPLIDYGPYGKRLETISHEYNYTGASILQTTKNTKLKLGCSMEHKINKQDVAIKLDVDTKYHSSIKFVVDTKLDETIILEKFVSYVSETSFKTCDVFAMSRELVEKAKEIGFSKLELKQSEFLKNFWQNTEIKIDGDDALQQGLRFNIFHVLQGTGQDGNTSMPAKGLTGEGYEGHYFWDTEMYSLPLFISTNPEIARNLLNYRFNKLDEARKIAKIMGHEKGALFPWRTINGEEASTYYPQGTAQYHINGDVAYSFKQYIEYTNDIDFLIEKAAEIFIETARVWVSLGSFVSTREGKFCISDVTGPDEYTSIVDNNFYTNQIAQENLYYAIDAINLLKSEYEKDYIKLKDKIDFDESELKLFKKAADNMYFHFNNELGIYGQDDTFLYKKAIEIDSIPENKLPMLLNFHPLVVYRYRLAKQADLIMAMTLFSHKFTKEEKIKHFDFYDSVTLHDSSLSTCIFSILANDIGYKEKAYDYFACTSRLDIDDYHKNVYSGIHAANMAGTWLGIVKGFAQMKIIDGKLSFSPSIPKKWNEYSFNITYRNRLINIKVDKFKTEAKLIKGEKISIKINNEIVELSR